MQEEEEGDPAEAQANMDATGNKFGLALDDLIDQGNAKQQRQKQAKPLGNKLGVKLSGKRGSRSLKQAQRKSKLVEKGIAFAERLSANAEKIYDKKRGRLGLKSLY